jgi:acyl-CoA synthetase (AMP-forming)/AMP-acid ligase II
MNMTIPNLGSIASEYKNESYPAIIDLTNPNQERVISYQEYHAGCDAVARGLLKLGLKEGDRIGIVSGNRAEFLEVFYGSMRAGIVPVLLNILQTKESIEWMIENSDVKLLFCESVTQDKCPANIPSINLDCDAPNSFSKFKDPGVFTAIVPTYDQEAFHAYTSGSTGRPKGVILSHRAHVWVAENISRDRNFSPKDRMVVAAPLYHKHAMNSIKCVLVGGSTVILMRKFDAKTYVEYITRYQATVVSGVPTMFAMMMQQKELLVGNDYSFVRLATLGGAPASDVLIDQVAVQFPNAEIVKIYGITEASSALFGSNHKSTLIRPRHSIGWPIAGNEFKLVGGDDENQGVLHVRSPGMMNGYVNNPEETQKRIQDRWYNTGDILRKDDVGWYFFVGRSDDMFVSSGHNIYPLEVELMLEKHPEIAQAVVVSVPDEIKYRLPVTFIVLNKGSSLTEEDIKAHALKNAPPYQYPRKVYLVDALPLNTIGKIDRKLLEKKALELYTTQDPRETGSSHT